MALRRYLVLGEETDTAWCPWWYPVLKAAKECNTTPWDLLAHSIFWKDVALKSLIAENQAREILDKHPRS